MNLFAKLRVHLVGNLDITGKLHLSYLARCLEIYNSLTADDFVSYYLSVYLTQITDPLYHCIYSVTHRGVFLIILPSSAAFIPGRSLFKIQFVFCKE